MPEAKVTLVDGMQFRGETASGHTVMVDASAEFGGVNAGMRPMEAVLLAAASCTAMDVISILRKKRQNVTGYEVHISGTRADEHPRVFTHIRVDHIVRGKDVDPTAVERAVELSATKYCSVLGMLRKTAEVVTTFRVEEEKLVPVKSGKAETASAGRP